MPDCLRAHTSLRVLAVVAGIAMVAAACASPLEARHEDKRGGASTTSTTAKPRELAPLTGEPEIGDVDLRRRALAFKIDNAPGAQPQAGLDQADVVFEEVVEGGLTRFMAVYQSRDADPVGPVRSVRPVDVDLAETLGDPVLVYSGGQEAVVEEVKSSGITTFSDDEGDPGFERASEGGHVRPHDLFSSTVAVYENLGTTLGAPPRLALFGTGTLPAGTPAVQVTAIFSEATTERWRFDQTTGQYERMRGEEPQKLLSGADLEVDNLVFQTVEAVSTGLVDSTGADVPSWRITGEGRLWVARDGSITSGTWRRTTPGDDIAFVTDSGEVITLRPGTTWWSLMPVAGAVRAE